MYKSYTNNKDKPDVIDMKRPKSKYDASSQGWQYCEKCKKDTWHTPKLGLVSSNRRLCTMCSHSNLVNVPLNKQK